MLNTLATYNYLYWTTTGGNDTTCYFYIYKETFKWIWKDRSMHLYVMHWKDLRKSE